MIILFTLLWVTGASIGCGMTSRVHNEQFPRILSAIIALCFWPVLIGYELGYRWMEDFPE